MLENKAKKLESNSWDRCYIWNIKGRTFGAGPSHQLKFVEIKHEIKLEAAHLLCQMICSEAAVNKNEHLNHLKGKLS